VNGEALVELGKYENSPAKIEKGILRMKKALNMCFKQNQRHFEKEIESQLKKAQKIKWYKENEIEQRDRLELMAKLQHKMNDNVQDLDLYARFSKFLHQNDPH
jgi:STIP1 family protein 1